ncbi:MAG: zinc-ribbon domain-containing protein [Ruminiclostridium sp.]
MANVINDFLTMAKDATDSAVRKKDELYMLSKLKLSFVQLNNKVKARYEALGNRLYEMYKSGNENTTELLGMVDEIDDLFKKMAETQRKIDELSKFISCPKCSAKNKIDSVYCNKCGTKLVATDEAVEENENQPAVEQYDEEMGI